MGQIKREMEEILNVYLFRTYNPVGYEHIAERHMEINLKDLQKRLSKIPFDKYGDIQSMSRFLKGMSMEQVCTMIYGCMSANEKNIRTFLSGNTVGKARDYYMDFPHPIGEGIVKGTDECSFFEMSRLCVIVGHSDNDERKMEIISAYPVFAYDEIDDVIDAVEEWQSGV